MPNFRDYFQYKNNFIVSADLTRSWSYFLEAVDLNKDKIKDVILFGFTFPTSSVTIGIPQASNFYFGTGNSSYMLANSAQITLPATTHPREIAYGDFNKDGKLDIFLADHGWDTAPFPGGQNQLLLSSPSGWTLNTQNLPQRNDFTHSTSVGDINNDGNLDIFLGNVNTGTAPYDASILFGDGTGKFTESTSAVPTEIRGPIRFYAAHLADLNKDGLVDLVIGNSGDKNNIKSESIVYWNEKGKFTNEKFTLLPNGFFGSKNEQILDIQNADINNDGSTDLVVLATQNNPFYDGWSLQILSNKNGTFVDITADAFGTNISSMGTPYQGKKMPWVAFIKLVDVNNDGTIDILFDSIKSNGFTSPETQPLVYLNDGFGHYSPIFAGDVLDLDATYRDFFANASSYVGESGISWVNYFSYQNSIYFRELVPIKDLPKLNTIKGTNESDFISGNELDNNLYGLAGNDTLVGGKGNDFIDGGTGIDVVKVENAFVNSEFKNYSITKSDQNSWKVSYIGPITTIYPPSSTDGIDTLINVERLRFSDKSFALDLDGNAGKAVKVIGSVLGSNFVNNPAFVGLGIDYLDKGMSYSELGALALKAVGAITNDLIVSKLWLNVLGFAASAEQKAPFIKMLVDGTAVGDLVVLAADTTFNLSNINLIGLTQLGIEYTPIA